MKRTAALSLFLFLFLAANAHAAVFEGIFIVDNEGLVKGNSNVVIHGSQFLIFHTYDYVSVNYSKGNQTYFSREKQVGKSLTLNFVDGATLIIKDSEGNVILNTNTHKATLSNILKYNIGLPNFIFISILAVIFSLAFVYSYLNKREVRIL